MREIKFRAWDQDAEKFWYWELGYLHNDFWHHCRTLNHPVMQYTGLKDKDGREIYEGDILKRRWAGDDDELVFKVVFGNGRFAEWWTGMLEQNCADGSVLRRNSEIIGNIYENPELLKGGNNGTV